MPVLLHVEASQLICSAYQLTGFCMTATLALDGVRDKICQLWETNNYNRHIAPYFMKLRQWNLAS